MAGIAEQSLSDLTFINSSFPGCHLKRAWKLRVIMLRYTHGYLVFVFGSFKTFEVSHDSYRSFPSCSLTSPVLIRLKK